MKHREGIRIAVGWAAWLITMGIMFWFGAIHLSTRNHKIFLYSVLFLSLCNIILLVLLYAAGREGGGKGQ